MSRSYRKTPLARSNENSKLGKRLANKNVRQNTKAVGDGCHYKKFMSSYDIIDYKDKVTLETHISNWRKGDRYLKEFKSEEEVENWYKRIYTRK